MAATRPAPAIPSGAPAGFCAGSFQQPCWKLPLVSGHKHGGVFFHFGRSKQAFFCNLCGAAGSSFVFFPRRHPNCDGEFPGHGAVSWQLVCLCSSSQPPRFEPAVPHFGGKFGRSVYWQPFLAFGCTSICWKPDAFPKPEHGSEQFCAGRQPHHGPTAVQCTATAVHPAAIVQCKPG
jgi:hypothetical protein